MKVVLNCYLTEGCKFVNGPYGEEWHGCCPYCQGRVGFFRAFGTEAERSVQIRCRSLAEVIG